MTQIAHCIGCGCHDYAACEDLETGGPCHWLAVDYEEGRGVCSACPEDLERWEAGDHALAVPVCCCDDIYIDDDERIWADEDRSRSWHRLDERRDALRNACKRRRRPGRHGCRPRGRHGHVQGRSWSTWMPRVYLYSLAPCSPAQHRLIAWGWEDDVPF